MSSILKSKVVVIGAGFTGLSAAYELALAGCEVLVLEAEEEIGGLASAFNVGGERLDRFYHHWFTNDLEVMGLVNELKLDERVEINPTNTGIYYANNFFKLSTPLDVLRFSPLSFLDRIRLGLLAIRARRVKNWMDLENLTAHEWLKNLGGENVYRIVWEPLLKGKFGPFAETVSAVWFWNKLKLRGGSRGKAGEERLAYFKGGFIGLAEELARKIELMGGAIKLSSSVERIDLVDKKWEISLANEEKISAEYVVATVALPLIAKMIGGWATEEYKEALNRIQYIGNVCLVLELSLIHI